jgi:hypothetical protein
MSSETRISCQYVAPAKGFDMKNRPKPRGRLVDYHLGCCIETRFWKIARKKEVEDWVAGFTYKSWSGRIPGFNDYGWKASICLRGELRA